MQNLVRATPNCDLNLSATLLYMNCEGIIWRRSIIVQCDQGTYLQSFRQRNEWAFSRPLWDWEIFSPGDCMYDDHTAAKLPMRIWDLLISPHPCPWAVWFLGYARELPLFHYHTTWPVAYLPIRDACLFSSRAKLIPNRERLLFCDD